MNTIKSSDKYSKYFTNEYLMGPNSIRLADELLLAYPLNIEANGIILDLGCGTGLTSLFIANETGANVYANDLWIDPEENLKRFQKWNMDKRIIPVHSDANQLDFQENFFDAVISIDSYHYFAGKKNFFKEKILPFVKNGGTVLIAVPGVKEEYEGRQKELLGEWLGDDYYMFHSCKWWQNIIGVSPCMEFVNTWELKNFKIAWEEWLQLDNIHTADDKKHYSEIKKCTCFIGIAVKKKRIN